MNYLNNINFKNLQLLSEFSFRPIEKPRSPIQRPERNICYDSNCWIDPLRQTNKSISQKK